MNTVKSGFCSIGWLKRSLAALFVASSFAGTAHAQCVPPPSGIVAWWKGEGNTADSIGSNNGIVTNGTLGYAATEVGLGFNFDGSPTRLLVPDSPSLDFGSNQNFTIEGWIRAFPTNTPQGVMTIIDKRYVNGDSQCQGYELSLLYGQLNFRFSDNPSINGYQWSGGPSLYDGQLHHVAVTVQRNSMTGGNLYVDGVSILQFNPTLAPGDLTTSEPLRIGNHPDPSYTSFFNGQIDEFSIYRSALSSNQIASIYNAGTDGKCPPPPPTNSCYPVPSGIVAWWPGESNTVDIINGNDGTAVGDLTYASGEVGQTFVLDGSTSYITVPSSHSLDVGTNGTGLTIECWVNPATANGIKSDGAPIMEWDSSFTDGAQFWVQGDGSLFTDIKDSSNTGHTLVSAARVAPSNTWTHVALTYDKSSGTVLMYANGNVVASGNFGTITPQTSYPLNIGRRTGQPIGDGDTFAGSIDELSLYNRALGSNEIAGIFDAGSDGKCPPINTNNPVTIPAFIINQPSNQTVTVSGTAIFSVVAGGTAPLSYVWMSVGTNSTIVGTNATLIFTNVQPSQAGGYEVFVSNPYGTTNSIVATLTVNSQTGTPPRILFQPSSETVTAGGAATFEVTASGTGPLNIQWTFDGSNIVGATSVILGLTNVQSSQAGTYQVQISNAYGVTNSIPVTLTVISGTSSCYPAPSGIVAWWPGESNTVDIINGNNGVVTNGTLGYAPAEVGLGFNFDGSPTRLIVPDSPSLDFGSNQDFTIEGWIRAFNPSNAPEDVMTIIDKRFVNGSTQCQGYEFSIFEGQLNFRMSDDPNGNGGEWAGGPNLYDGQLHHVAVTVQRNSTTGGNLYVDGVSVVQFDPTVVPGDLTTTEPLRIGNHPDPSYVSFFDGQIDEFSLYKRALGSNEIVAIFSAGSDGKCPPTNNPVGVAPFIENQPSNQTVTADSTVTFSVVAGGTAPLSYVWMSAGTNSTIVGTNATLIFTNVQPSQAGGYEVFVSNPYGTTNSVVATLTVNSQTGMPPYIISLSPSETVDAGGLAFFSVFAGGTQPLSYQWTFDGSNIVGATGSILSMGNVQVNQSGTYQVQVSNAYGVTNSIPVTLTVISGTSSCYPAPSGIVAWWPGESNTVDIINGNNGVVTNGTLGYAAAEVGLGFNFDGNPTRLIVPDSPSLDFGSNQDFTIEGWIRAFIPSNAPGEEVMTIIDKRFVNGGTQCQGYEFSIFNSQLNFRMSDDPSGNGGEWSGGPNLYDGQLHHVAVTVQRNSTTGGNLYVDGVSVVQFDPTVVPGDLTTTEPLRIGNHPDPSYASFFDGQIDEFALYKRALGSNEIASIYGAGSEGKCPPQTDIPPFIITQPTNQTAIQGSTAHFTVVAGGTSPLSYVWMTTGTNSLIVGTNATLIFSNVQPNQAGGYQVFVSNPYGSTNSIVVTLTVNSQTGTPPFITRQPTNETVTIGSSATFNVSAGGTAPLSYVWRLFGTNIMIVGTNATLTLNNVQTNEAGGYQATVSNAYGTTNSIIVTLTVNPQIGTPPFITKQPTNQTVTAGGTVRFTVGTGGSAPLSYIWKLVGTNSLIVGTNSSLLFSNVQPSQAGGYQVTVSNPYGTTNSTVATLTVMVPPAIQHMTARPNGLLTLDVTNASSMPYVLYCTTNLMPPIVWKPIYTNYSGKAWEFTDTNNCGNGSAKFYMVSPTTQ